MMLTSHLEELRMLQVSTVSSQSIRVNVQILDCGPIVLSLEHLDIYQIICRACNSDYVEVSVELFVMVHFADIL